MLKSQTFRPLTTFYIAKKQHCKHVIYNVVKKYKLAANFANPLSGDVLLNASRKGGTVYQLSADIASDNYIISFFSCAQVL